MANHIDEKVKRNRLGTRNRVLKPVPRYHISKASLMRWNKRFNGSRESLADKSHRPHTPHPNAHSETELKWIRDLHRRNPHISLLEMYGKLKTNKGYKRHPLSLYRVLVERSHRND